MEITLISTAILILAYNLIKVAATQAQEYYHPVNMYYDEKLGAFKDNNFNLAKIITRANVYGHLEYIPVMIKVLCDDAHWRKVQQNAKV